MLNPSLYSGDDRDFCEYTHSRGAASGDPTAPSVLVREVTVKSFSPDKSIRRPGFHLLSLVPPTAGAPVDPGLDLGAFFARADATLVTGARA